MVQIYYLLLITLTSFGNCRWMQIPPGTCKDGEVDWMADSKKICCNREWHVVYRHPTLCKTCNVEPTDPNLTFEDSNWLAYDCLVRKSLRPTKLSLQSYTSFVSGLPESSVNGLLGDSSDNNATSSDDEISSRVQTIKSYFYRYLEALQGVCSHGYNQTSLSIGNNETEMRDIEEALRTAQSATACYDGVFPLMRQSKWPQIYDHLEERKCKEILKASVGNVTSEEIYSNATRFCSWAQSENLKLHDIPSTVMEFETFSAILWPGFWSKVVKQNATRDLMQVLKSNLNTTVDSNTPEVVVPALLVTIRKNLGNALKDDEQLMAEELVVNSILAFEIISASSYVQQFGVCVK